MSKCSRCRRENWPLHKVRGFLNCEDCLTGGFQMTSRALFGGIWNGILRVVGRMRHVFRPSVVASKRIERAAVRPPKEIVNIRPSKIIRVGGSYQRV